MNLYLLIIGKICILNQTTTDLLLDHIIMDGGVEKNTKEINNGKI